MKLEFQSDGGACSDGAYGLIVLQTDLTMEPELAPVFGGFGLYHTRIPNAPEVTPDTLAAMAREMPRTAALLPPEVRVIGYGCTSGATIIGPERVADLIRQAQPQAAVTDPISALLAACTHLGVRRLGFVTPYVAEVSAAMRARLEGSGLEIAGFGSFEQIEDRVVAGISEASTLAAIEKVAGIGTCDAIFASCTNLRGFGIIERAEAATGVPVLTSNLALGWHMLRLAGAETAGRGPGRLFAGDIRGCEAGRERVS